MTWAHRPHGVRTRGKKFDQLSGKNSNEAHMGCQVGKVYRLVLQAGEGVHAVLAIRLAFTMQARKKSSQKGEESPYDRVRRLSSPRSREVALVPFPGDFAPLPTQTETGLACSAGWEFPPNLKVLESRPIHFWLVVLAEVGDTVTADHLIQMATLPAERKPTALGIPAHLPIPYHFRMCTGHAAEFACFVHVAGHG